MKNRVTEVNPTKGIFAEMENDWESQGGRSDWLLKHDQRHPLAQPSFRDQPEWAVTKAPRRLLGAAEVGRNRCPTCLSIIYSRRHRLCGVCAHPLPPECLFSQTEAQRIEFQMELERQRHRQWLAKVTV